MEILESKLIPISKLIPNTGQIEGVPKNPRTIKGAAFEKLKASIESDESHLYTNELKVYELDGKFVVLSGNMRLKACKALKIKQIPCKVIPQDWSLEQICKEVIISNVSSGEWNSEDLANEWDFAPLDDWGVEIVPSFEPSEPTDDELIGEEKGNLPTMKITFKTPEQLQKAEIDIQEILDRKYQGAFFSVSCGEI
jgi:hypothetical protein